MPEPKPVGRIVTWHHDSTMVQCRLLLLGVGRRKCEKQSRADQNCTDRTAEVRHSDWMTDSRGPLLTRAACQAKTDEKFAQADREPRHRRRLLTAADGWVVLAGIMGRLEASTVLPDEKRHE
jgi:hypothetical protein